MGARTVRLNIISIHAPRTGSDDPANEAIAERRISIHAPRTGSDTGGGAGQHRHRHFNPRSPHGERQHGGADRSTQHHFNPRSPHGERQKTRKRHARRQDFNPRSPHGERQIVSAFDVGQTPFQSTLPARGATLLALLAALAAAISIHAPRTGSDLAAGALCWLC